MCGIAGAINYYKYDLNAIRNSLLHRGPDSQDIYKEKNVALVHTRLSIQDIENGQQPFHYKNYSIILNGEIYNHLDLRNELKEFEFQTVSDTETLLYLFIKFKEKMYEKIDGMFSFCIYDRYKEELILAKDRAGKKPVYLYKEKDSILFASELNAIKNSSNDIEINNDAIESYLRNGLFYDTYTPYKNVFSLKAGYFYTICTKTLKINEKKYFDILDYYKEKSKLNKEDTLSTVDGLLHKSVKNRLESSDLEVGAFLSGGIDSSLIVAIASEYKNKLKTFTVKFDDNYDESHLAKLTANKYNTLHTELKISMNLKNDIETILFNYGKPFMDSSAIPSYYVSKEAKKHVSVILNGDGADEIFGGYRRYVPFSSGILPIAKYFNFLLKVLPKPHNKKAFYNYIYRLLNISNKKSLNLYNSSTIDIFENEYIFPSNKINSNIEKFIDSIKLDPLSKMLYLDFCIILHSNLLEKMDIATMSNSLEGRSPFLSKYILEFAPTMQNKYKVNGVTTKYILRELAKKYLPKELISQPKRGFEVPLKSWIESDLKDNIYDSLQNNSYSSNFIDSKFINDLLNKKINVSEEKRAKMLWTMYCLEVWKKNNE